MTKKINHERLYNKTIYQFWLVYLTINPKISFTDFECKVLREDFMEAFKKDNKTSFQEV